MEKIDPQARIANIEREILDKMRADISQHWSDAWDINIKDDSSPAPNLTIDELLPIFIAQELTFFNVKHGNAEQFAYMLALILSGVERANTHSREAIRSAVQKYQKNLKPTLTKKLKARWSTASREWRQAFAFAAIWIVGAILYGIFFREYGSYLDDSEVSEIIISAVIPPSFGLFSFWLYKKLTA